MCFDKAAGGAAGNSNNDRSESDTTRRIPLWHGSILHSHSGFANHSETSTSNGSQVDSSSGEEDFE